MKLSPYVLNTVIVHDVHGRPLNTWLTLECALAAALRRRARRIGRARMRGWRCAVNRLANLKGVPREVAESQVYERARALDEDWRTSRRTEAA